MSCMRHLLMVTSPSGLCSILSMPLGPREDLSVLATVLAARMLALTASVPRSRDLLPCSYSIMTKCRWVGVGK